MWCGTGKTRTFTVDIFIQNQPMNVLVFPSLGLINQYSNDYILEEPFQSEFEKYKCLAFCSEDDGKLKSKGSIIFTTHEKTLMKFIQCKHKKIIMVTYQSFEKFIGICIDKNTKINQLIYDEAHHIVGDKIQKVVFNNEELDSIVDKTRFYTATPVNKNGITMYDEEGASDCGVLAYEYLYYQAIQDNICKPFETQISLYTQTLECKNKNQPIFESIIRTCLSGNYSYWNVLTFHSFVEESDTQNDMISFVKEFASVKNQALLKKLFTKIQNEEFPHTKENFRVEHVILKGVSSKTPCKEEIIKDFDRKVEGRIYILASCGILNEGIDTKWANMGVPINPTKSIVKESQRIGRLVRIPEKNMSPAIILIPCQVDITRYASMDTPEQRDQMIREQLSECGNFNTALNVISAFQYQYDPDIFEMCLQYPNMYAPKEVKDNLENHGLHVEESQGTLIDNLKYLSGIDLSEEGDDATILNRVAKQQNKPIEIYSQNYEQPITYINEEAIGEPLRLYFGDKTYSPIVKKKENIPKITSPKKRPKLFNVHMHPDLEVLWNIREDSIDLSKAFSQGILDVNVSYNDKKWNETFYKVKAFMEINKTNPKEKSDNDERKLSRWVSTQKSSYKNKKHSMKNIEIYDTWKEFTNDVKYSQYFMDNTEKWYETFYKVKAFMDINKTNPKEKSDNDERKLGQWVSNQIKYYGIKKYKYSMKVTEIYDTWSEFINDEIYSKYFMNYNEIWYENFNNFKIFIDSKDKSPSSKSSDKDESFLGKWKVTQNNNYIRKKNTMKNKNIYDTWKEFINDEKYNIYFIDNNEKWYETFENLKKFISKNSMKPNRGTKDKNEKKLGEWLSHQTTNFVNKQKSMKNENIYDTWKEFINDEKYNIYLIYNNEKIWNKYYKLLLELNDTPTQSYNTECDIHLGCWCDQQRQKKKKGKLSQEQIELLEKIPNWYWDKKDMSKPEIKPHISTGSHKPPPQSALSELHKQYKTMTSEHLHDYFNQHPDQWDAYHKISQENERSFPTEDIPRNKMIHYLNTLPGKKRKVVADLGCGKAEINQYFKENDRFVFHNFDHHSDHDLVISRDIKHIPLEDYSVDIAILSLAMWGSNCKEYIQEAYRILDTGCTLLIAEPYKRWNKELNEKPVNTLVKLLEENNFTIIQNEERKFMFIECRKT